MQTLKQVLVSCVHPEDRNTIITDVTTAIDKCYPTMSKHRKVFKTWSTVYYNCKDNIRKEIPDKGLLTSDFFQHQSITFGFDRNLFSDRKVTNRQQRLLKPEECLGNHEPTYEVNNQSDASLDENDTDIHVTFDDRHRMG
ncbi:unnamed protein product [Didymodactylos carnosus]|uniref:Uncharacterized protein n=1 Tax=Didymodactylos carnosus TaxID=1234261 RepID=A0A814AJ96_9BILA|nr:unnamed protein product [Didymodactylos carnosus]CAF0934992.1 unnamed protein product [Didymodactylos carnosus]CAF3694833.1 unnamed protein product [Didymodactylos carnosus]CAF3710914.1 unnamed protein product [Didymodactylos carnosus]